MIWIAIAVFLVIAVIVGIWMKGSYLHLVQYEEGEKIIQEFDGFSAVSHGKGGTPSLFPKCKMVVTDKRIILAQKVLWQNKFKLHYFMWKDGRNLGKLGLSKGVVLFPVNDESIAVLNDKETILQIIPSAVMFITKIEIKNPPAEMIQFFTNN